MCIRDIQRFCRRISVHQVFTLLGLSIFSFHPSEAEKTGRPETPVAEDFENEGIEGLSFLEETHILVLEKRCKFSQIYFCFFGCSDFFS